MQNQTEIPFNELLAAMRDESTPLPARLLYRLSDLAGDELQSFASTWAQVGRERRLRLVEDLETLEESYTLASFLEIYKLAIADQDPLVCVTGLRAVWEYEEPDLIPSMRDRLANGQHAVVRAQAASALGRFVYLGELEEISQETSTAVVDDLLAVFESDSGEDIRRRALESLGFSGRESIADHISEAFQYGDEAWIASALVAMGRSLSERWYDSVVDKLEDDDPVVRLEAVRAAGLLGIEESIPLLIDLLEEQDEDLRFAAIWSLSEIGGEDARDALDQMHTEIQDDEELDFLESAMENLFLNDEIKELSLLDFSEDDLDDLSNFPDDDLEE